MLGRNFLQSSPFVPAIFDNEINRTGGVDIELYPSQLCPCFDPSRGKPKYDCDLCEFLGYIYDEPINTKALISNRSLTTDFREPGNVVTGQASAVFLTGIYVGSFYKIRVRGEKIVVNNELMIRGEKFVNGSSRERVRFQEILSVDQLRTLTRIYVQGRDFTISADKRTIVWNEGAPQPANGEQYSVRYKTFAEYLIMHYEPIVRALMKDNESNIHVQLQRLEALELKR